ncbi:MAG: response regulator transcription factor [Acidimicrobiales bacterium]
MRSPLQAVLAEDNLLVREGLCSLLRTSGRVEVCAACSSLPELFRAVEAHRPDVVLTDVRMPPGHSDEGVQAARSLRESHPDLGVVVVSQFADPGYVSEVLAAGSKGRAYILKDRVHDVERLLRAIEAVAVGDSFLDDEVVEALVRARSRRDTPIEWLTAREREVLAEVASGASNAAIANALRVSGNAVEKHINAIFAKLGLFDGRSVNRRVKAALVHIESVNRLAY